MSKKTNNAAKVGKRINTNTRHYFAGANTSSGFFNLFDQINDATRDGLLYILKGGPGTGKSTLMKSVGRAFSELGEEVEYFYCSSDYQSLDGVRLACHNIAIVDGTAPHVTEAQMPGIRERIINLGEYIGEGIKLYEKDITTLLQKKKGYFDLAYSYIESASRLYESSNAIFASEKSRIKPSAAARKILDCLKLEKLSRTNAGKERRLYLSAVAESGSISLEEANKFSNVITLSYNSYVSKAILDCIKNSLKAGGHEIISFCDLLSQDSTSAIFIPSDGTLIRRAGLNEGYTGTALGREKSSFIEYNQRAINELLSQAASALAQAKKMHKKVESYYIPKMDFESITKITTSLIGEIKSKINLQAAE